MNFNCHYGDLHYYKEFIKDIINKTDFDEYYLLEYKSSSEIFKDVDNIKFDYLNNYCYNNQTYYQINNDFYLNIHYIRDNEYFQYNFEDNKVLNYKTLVMFYYNYFSYIYDKLNIFLSDVTDYTPSIDYTKYDISSVDNYLKNNNKFKVLISNGDCLSAQSSNEIDFFYIVDNLSKLYPDIDFILTSKINLERSNVLYTDDINSFYPDLIQISYLSTFCNIIIGKASGPYCFTLTRNNYEDENKTFIAICKEYSHGFYTEYSRADRILINNFDNNNIFDILNQQINKKYNLYVNMKYIKFLDVTKDKNKIIFSSKVDLHNVLISTYTDISGKNIFTKTYGTHFETISKNISYFMIIDIITYENTKFKLHFYTYNKFIHEIII